MSLLSEESTLYYREITLADKGYMQCLCLECFPIEYPDTWFNYLLQGDDWTYTLGAFEMATDRMVGMIVGQVQTLDHIEKDYGYVLEEAQAGEIIMYITIFGVSEEYRCRGVGSALMTSLVNFTNHQTVCKVIYLHVEADNSTAIRFYQRRGFSYHCTDRGYYTMPEDEKPSDGHVYLQYINNGRPYKPSVENWCRRNVWTNPIGQCLAGAVRGPWNSIKHAWQRSLSSPS